jgi:large subunit ribosomal protein L13
MSKAPVRHRATITDLTAASESPERDWYVADLEGKTLGRAVSKIASVLRGKHSARFVPHQDNGSFVVVINAEKIKLTGKKWDEKEYNDHSLFPGGIRTYTAKELMQRHPTDLVKRAVWGMLPKGPLGRRLYKKLKVYAGKEHPHAAQTPKTLSL